MQENNHFCCNDSVIDSVVHLGAVELLFNETLHVELFSCVETIFKLRPFCLAAYLLSWSLYFVINIICLLAKISVFLNSNGIM